MNKHESLISNLSSNLAPVSPPPNINRLALAWFALSAIYVVAVTQLFGPIRPGAITQLGTEPRFLLETMLGVAAILWFSLLAFRSAIPAALTRQFAAAGLVLMALWLAQYVIGFISPALEPSRLGKRNYCYFETMVYSTAGDPGRSVLCSPALSPAPCAHRHVHWPGGGYAARPLSCNWPVCTSPHTSLPFTFFRVC